MDFLRKLKLFLYIVSAAEIIILGEFAKRSGQNVKMAVAALLLVGVNVVIYKLAFRRRGKEKENGTR
ncbi:MAG: hypothetical protein LBQ47_06005 [Endomicrobium sp.]|jgi:hypothetical protein|nr:hypothetical protein [Endomicrobium sp.]